MKKNNNIKALIQVWGDFIFAANQWRVNETWKMGKMSD